jgi:hypothetical protein
MRAALLLFVGAAIAAPANAGVPTVRIGKIDSEKECTLYQMTSGRHREAGAVDTYGAAYASETSWTSYLVRDCVDNFASLRTSLQAALASSGKLAVVSGASGGGYVVSGRISDVSGGGPAAPAQSTPNGGFSVSSSNMFVNMDVTLRDASGRIVYGGLLTKKLETGFSMETQGLSSSSSQSGQAVYTELQHQVALAVARIVAFKIEPMRVTSANGHHIQLDYGAPLLQLGTMIQVTAPNGTIVRYTVTGAGQGSAEADYYGGGDASNVVSGSVAGVIESDDPVANARRFEKVDLP